MSIAPSLPAHIAEHFDLVLAADFSIGGDMSFRLAGEIQHFAGRNFAVGLLQIRKPNLGAVIAAEVQTCLRRGLARIAGEGVNGRILVLHSPTLLASAVLDRPWPDLREVVVICHQSADLDAADALAFNTDVRRKTYASSAEVRQTASGRVEKSLWVPPASADSLGQDVLRTRAPAIGWLGGPPITVPDSPFEQVSLDDLPVSMHRMVAGVNVLALRVGNEIPPSKLVAAMQSAGRPIIADVALKPQFGKGPIYVSDDVGFAEAIRDFSVASAPVTPDFLKACRRAPIARIGAKRIKKQIPAPVTARRRPVLCLSSNGVGVGHLTRLLAIARRLREEDIVFVTQAQATGVVESFGYPVEYIPSPGAVGGNFELWDQWFGVHLGRLLDRYDPSMVVYDGNHPSTGLMAAVAARSDLQLVWVRRGMWGTSGSSYIENARWCDLVIEPGELAADLDVGITAKRRREALIVDPIRLLEPEDLFSRDVAAARLGLNPAKPAVLVQLGSGFNRDLLTMLDQTITILSAVPNLQIAVTEWVNGSIPLTLWPNVTVLRGFPVTQYLKAFDICISAAGYNSFHEMIGFAMPTIFVANRHPSMDDQYGRARFAQESGAAFEVSEADLHALAEIVPLLLNKSARDYLTANCRRLERPNGADAAAAALTALVRQGHDGTIN